MNQIPDKKFWKIKNEIRILGVDDGPFTQGQEKVLIIGTMFRAGTWLDGVLSTHITGDGNDATSRLVEMVTISRHRDQIGVIMLDGITFGGFNVVDIQKIFQKTGIPIIVIMRKEPDLSKIKKALERFSDGKKRWDLVKKAGKILKIDNPEPIYIQISGISSEDAEEIVKLAITRSAIPEPIRVAHIIASGVVTGDSRGSA
ncbi:MAG TPA: DUF99 family protein [Methanobacteriaceae archaeon]|nr:DUF99 family protein [Methanobacteriaceae archaeon]